MYTINVREAVAVGSRAASQGERQGGSTLGSAIGGSLVESLCCRRSNMYIIISDFCGWCSAGDAMNIRDGKWRFRSFFSQVVLSCIALSADTKGSIIRQSPRGSGFRLSRSLVEDGPYWN